MNQEKAEHGDEYKGDLLANFSSNVWFGAEHERLYAHLTNRMPLVRRYPEEYNAELKQILPICGSRMVLPKRFICWHKPTEGRNRLSYVPHFQNMRRLAASMNTKFLFVRRPTWKMLCANNIPMWFGFVRPTTQTVLHSNMLTSKR